MNEQQPPQMDLRDYMARGLFFDQAGNPISLEGWAYLLMLPDEQSIACEVISDKLWVSTVWLGIDHRILGVGPPLIFETMVFRDGVGMECERYSTREEAVEGHDRILEQVKAEVHRK